MTARTTISFSQPGVQPPVYVVTSLSNPPWETLELAAEGVRTSTGDLIFSRHFDDAAEGSYQYKIRVGEGHWVVDESKETATDEHGNRNNVIQVKAPPLDIRKDSTMDVSGLSKIHNTPVPFVVVEKVEDKEQPEIGDVKPQSLPVDVAKRAADAQPDIEVVRVNSPIEAKQSNAPKVPLLVVENTDDKLLLEKLVIASGDHVKPSTNDEQADPLFPYESDRPEALPAENIDEGSVQSSTDQTSSDDVVNTPSEEDETFENDELNHGSLLSHEARLGRRISELDRVPKLAHEEDIEEDDVDELNNGRLLPHEARFFKRGAIHNDDEDELSKSPLLSHETGFSQFKGSDAGEYSDDDMTSPHSRRFFKGGAFESSRVPSFPHEAMEDNGYDEYGSPLLPHERSMSAISISGSERSLDDGLFLLDKRPMSGYETTSARDHFGRSDRASIFRTGTGHSTLPHKMPKTDEEDEALRDVSLESFPTSREQIFERVATIGHRLPEDQVVGEQHSPSASVLSQACSSADLRPIRSYASMPSVQEESDDDDIEDLQGLDSPVMMSGPHTRNPRSISGFRKDPYATPKPEEEKQLEWVEEVKDGVLITGTTDFSGAGSVGKHDGTKESSTSSAKLVDSVDPPVRALNSLGAPFTSNEQFDSSRDNAVLTSDSEFRQRREPVEDYTKASPNLAGPSKDTKESLEDKVAHSVTPAASQEQQLGQSSEHVSQSLSRVVFGSVGHISTACLGDKKRTSVSILVAGAAVAAYYYLVGLA